MSDEDFQKHKLTNEIGILKTFGYNKPLSAIEELPLALLFSSLDRIPLNGENEDYSKQLIKEVINILTNVRNINKNYQPLISEQFCYRVKNYPNWLSFKHEYNLMVFGLDAPSWSEEEITDAIKELTFAELVSAWMVMNEKTKKIVLEHVSDEQKQHLKQISVENFVFAGLETKKEIRTFIKLSTEEQLQQVFGTGDHSITSKEILNDIENLPPKTVRAIVAISEVFQESFYYYVEKLNFEQLFACYDLFSSEQKKQAKLYNKNWGEIEAYESEWSKNSSLAITFDQLKTKEEISEFIDSTTHRQQQIIFGIDERKITSEKILDDIKKLSPRAVRALVGRAKYFNQKFYENVLLLNYEQLFACYDLFNDMETQVAILSNPHWNEVIENKMESEKNNEE